MNQLLCLHGFTGSSAGWDEVLAELTPRVQAWCPDLLGHGQAASRATRFADEIERLAEELQTRDLRAVHLVGYSLGARVGLGLLVRVPERFATATLIGVHPGLRTAAERQARAVADEALAELLEREGLAAFLAVWENLPLFAAQADLPAERRARQRSQRLQQSAGGLARALRVLGLAQMPDYWPALPQLTLPVRLLIGARDDKFQALAAEMLELLPQGELELVPGAGHNLVLEAPQAVAAALSRELN